MTALVAAVCGLAGLAVGSVLHVVIDRVPRREPVRPLAGATRVPVVSWRDEGRWSVQRPVVELATAALFVAAALRFDGEWVLPAFLLLFAVLVAVAVIDLRHYIVPNRIVFPTLAVSVPLLVLAAALDDSWGDLGRALIGAVAGGFGMAVLHLIQPRGMGMGDVKLALVLGLYLGWLGLDHVALGLFLGFLLGAVIGVVLLVTRIRSRKDHVPFAPFLVAGTVLAVLAGTPILDWYRG